MIPELRCLNPHPRLLSRKRERGRGGDLVSYFDMPDFMSALAFSHSAALISLKPCPLQEF